jgi:hypothetical protein
VRNLATSVAGTTSTFAIPGGMASDRPSPGYDRVLERRRAVVLVRHFREAEGLSIGEIADRLGRSPATIKAYFYDPTGEKARAVKARYVGVCRGCGAYTQPRNGKGDAYAYCKACHPGAIERRWTRGLVLEAMGEWLDRYGRLPSSYDWSVTHARRRRGKALARLQAGAWPAASVVTKVFGTWGAARAAAGEWVSDERSLRAWTQPGARACHGAADLSRSDGLTMAQVRSFEGADLPSGSRTSRANRLGQSAATFSLRTPAPRLCSRHEAPPWPLGGWGEFARLIV